ncbi:MAG: hypothetical protein OXM02_11575 [Bacteroidota bacterium]|nr:hypothetical protein [Bacteroidota bacterium]MDE2957784.1 hypothetical protein [Bacteroidota bacterium]
MPTSNQLHGPPVHGNTLCATLYESQTINGHRLLMRFTGLLSLAILLGSGILVSGPAAAQMHRIGFGLSGVASTQDPPVGLGIDTRFAWPINEDFSVAAGAGMVGFVFRGREGASYFFKPSLSAIVTLQSQNPVSPYFIAGLGGYIPVGSPEFASESGPSIHAGLGWSFLLQTTAIYLEVSPMLVVARTTANVLLPVRFGVIL